MNKLYILILLIIPNFIYSQQYEVQETDSIDIINYEEYMGKRIERLLKKNQQIYFDKGGIEGSCVQIYSGDNREERDKIKYQCKEKFPELNVWWIRISPNWKVRVGKCRTELEAKKLQSIIKEVYPGSYIRDIIVPFGEFD